MPRKVNNLVGQTFGPFTVVSRNAENTKNGSARWVSRCKCGSIRAFTSVMLHGKVSKQSGCSECAVHPRQLPDGEAGLRRSERVYRKGAESRGYSWGLTTEQFRHLVSQECSYCQQPAKGIDRVDNTLGYEPENCVPCCGECNRMKHAMSISDYIEHCKRVADWHRFGEKVRLAVEESGVA